MAAAIIELYSLTDPVWAAAQNHHLSAITRGGFVFLLVSRVEVRCVGFELRCARIDSFVDWRYALVCASGGDISRLRRHQPGDPCIGKTIAFCFPKERSGKACERMRRQLLAEFCNLAQFVEEPGINMCEGIEFFNRKTIAQCM